MINKFSRALQLTKDESEEFKALVEYGQAQDPLDRNRYLKKLADLRVTNQLKEGKISSATWDKVPSWVTWVLYSLADQKNVNFDIAHLREIMRGRASLDEIRRSLKRLLDSGELKHDVESDTMVKGRLLMAGSGEVSAEMVRKLQSELIYLGLESLYQDEPYEREFGALTIALSEEEFEALKFELRHLRKRIFKDISVNREKSKGDRVYQLNVQLFPVTEKTTEKN